MDTGGTHNSKIERRKKRRYSCYTASAEYSSVSMFSFVAVLLVGHTAVELCVLLEGLVAVKLFTFGESCSSYIIRMNSRLGFKSVFFNHTKLMKHTYCHPSIFAIKFNYCSRLFKKKSTNLFKEGLGKVCG